MREENYQTEKIQVTVSESISLANGHQRPHQTKKDRSLSLSIKDPFLYDCSCFQQKRKKRWNENNLKNWFLLVAGAASCFLWESSFVVIPAVLFWSCSYAATWSRCSPSVYQPNTRVISKKNVKQQYKGKSYHSCCVVHTIHVDASGKSDQWTLFGVFHTTFNFQAVHAIFKCGLRKQEMVGWSTFGIFMKSNIL